MQTDALCTDALYRSERELIERYFYHGFRYESIVRFLVHYHNIDMSIRTLHRRLIQYGLHRYWNQPSLISVWNAVHAELRGPGVSICFAIYVALKFVPVFLYGVTLVCCICCPWNS